MFLDNKDKLYGFEYAKMLLMGEVTQDLSMSLFFEEIIEFNLIQTK